jgi:hypothetical protein
MGILSLIIAKLPEAFVFMVLRTHYSGKSRLGLSKGPLFLSISLLANHSLKGFCKNRISV